MGNWFKPLRRKIGLLTLVTALMLTGAWMRSLSKIDTYNHRAGPFVLCWVCSFHGKIAWLKISGADQGEPALFQEFARGVADFTFGQLLTREFGGSLNEQNEYHWKWQFYGIESGERDQRTPIGPVRVTIWKMSDWWIITPLALLSAWLLLSKPRQSRLAPPPRDERSI